jgi:potassium-transporting ATPase KdpC subunit
MARQIVQGLLITVVFTVLVGLVYPAAMTLISLALFPRQAQGSLITRNGKVVGSELIGQNFTQPKYFHGRPSATTDTDPKDPTKTIPAPYNAASSGGSNYGPTSKAWIERVAKDVTTLKAEHAGPVPVDLVTASGSGLDPHITPAAAEFQVARVAKARNVPEAKVRDLVARHTEGRTLGLLGEPRVNVLTLNLALDELPAK